MAFALAFASPVGADVVLKQKTVSEGLGGFGNSVVEKTLTVSGGKKTTAKKAEKGAEEKNQEMASPGAGPAGGPLLKVVTDLIQISAAPAAAGSFEVPAGYKKKG